MFHVSRFMLYASRFFQVFPQFVSDNNLARVFIIRDVLRKDLEEFTYDSKNPFVRYFNKYAGEVIIRDELQKDLEESGSMKHESRNMKHQVKTSGENIDI